MNTQHTPGPWQAIKVQIHVELGHFAPPAHYQIQAEQSPIGATLVCELRPYGKDNEANARLIAAAPEQNKELVAITNEVRLWDYIKLNFPERAEGIIAVIAKATVQ